MHAHLHIMLTCAQELYILYVETMFVNLQAHFTMYKLHWFMLKVCIDFDNGLSSMKYVIINYYKDYLLQFLCDWLNHLCVRDMWGIIIFFNLALKIMYPFIFILLYLCEIKLFLLKHKFFIKLYYIRFMFNGME